MPFNKKKKMETTESKALVKLLILGEITKRTYMQFEEALVKMQEQGQDKLPIIINSLGGFEDIGIMIATRMLAEPEKFVTYAPVQACSAATYIFLAAGERILGEMGHLLFHQTSLTDVTMSISKLQENLDECQFRDATMAKELSSHLGLVLEQYKALVNFGKDDTTRIWKDVATTYGFCTSVGTAVFGLNDDGTLNSKIALPRSAFILLDAIKTEEEEKTEAEEADETDKHVLMVEVAKSVTFAKTPAKELNEDKTLVWHVGPKNFATHAVRTAPTAMPVVKTLHTTPKARPLSSVISSPSSFSTGLPTPKRARVAGNTTSDVPSTGPKSAPVKPTRSFPITKKP